MKSRVILSTSLFLSITVYFKRMESKVQELDAYFTANPVNTNPHGNILGKIATSPIKSAITAAGVYNGIVTFLEWNTQFGGYFSDGYPPFF
ncbi:NilA [Xenorhabdus nematophila]|uniref:NilA n=2 Tax=Xenorhabdus nematophila TaxID=628 RepID=D3VIY7_XENNA|nr:hypothetical protein [Xenorhabdus nematophila]CEE90271.1 NilA [Xenorhabdus nematophila str. Anatoliense]CEF32443.1 NilA [Xenorhabdus nematophila str. Websteri]AAL79616.1 NilA [Xenorhabdus nematophila]AYA39889.1 NilA [Xenorhabdus nematophila]KHD28993.1 NilA [Xenorhabdus nematophila]